MDFNVLIICVTVIACLVIISATVLGCVKEFVQLNRPRSFIETIGLGAKKEGEYDD